MDTGERELVADDRSAAARLYVLRGPSASRSFIADDALRRTSLPPSLTFYPRGWRAARGIHRS